MRKKPFRGYRVAAELSQAVKNGLLKLGKASNWPHEVIIALTARGHKLYS
jgi:hypothetical protein